MTEEDGWRFMVRGTGASGGSVTDSPSRATPLPSTLESPCAMGRRWKD